LAGPTLFITRDIRPPPGTAGAVAVGSVFAMCVVWVHPADSHKFRASTQEEADASYVRMANDPMTGAKLREFLTGFGLSQEAKQEVIKATLGIRTQ